MHSQNFQIAVYSVAFTACIAFAPEPIEGTESKTETAPFLEDQGSLFAAADTTQTKKTKVRKPETQTSGSSYADEDEDVGFWEGCLSGIFDSICSSILSGSDDGPKSTVVVESKADEIEDEGATPLWLAVVEPTNPYAEDANIWDTPGGRMAEGSIVAALPRGTEVAVTETRLHNYVAWVRIEVEGYPEAAGWIPEVELVEMLPPFEEAPIEAVPTAETPYDMASLEETGFEFGMFRWQVLGELSYPRFSEGDINEEYKNAFGIGAEARRFFAHSLHVDFGFVYTHANGDPNYDFVVEGTGILESPSNSKLDVWSLNARFGQQYLISGGPTYFSWGVGPSVVHISESAFITIFEDGALIGTRTDELSEWKVGGQAKIEFGGLISGRAPAGLYFSYSLVPWNSKEEKSLTFDFLEKGRIDVFTFGLSFGYSF
jgi:hypothetical protein